MDRVMRPAPPAPLILAVVRTKTSLRVVEVVGRVYILVVVVAVVVVVGLRLLTDLRRSRGAVFRFLEFLGY